MAAVAGLSVVVRLLIGPIPADDAYITFRYSAHLAESGAFVYNANEPVLGTTTPLLTLLLAGAAWLGVPPAVAAFAISVVADASAIVLIGLVFRRTPWPAAGVAAGTLVAVWPGYLTFAVSGLETSLYVALIWLTVYLAGPGTPWRVGVAAGLALLCRPDAALLIGPLLVGMAGDARRRAAIVALAVVGPWALWATWYFGHPLPHSIIAKASQHALQDDWLGVSAFVRQFATRHYAVVSACALVGATLLWQRATRAVRIALGWWAVYSIAFAVSNGFAHAPWYVTPLLPLYFAAAAVGVQWLADRVREAAPVRLQPTIRAVPPVALTVLLAACLLFLPYHVRRLHRESEGREQLYATVARELAAQSSSATLAATEIGALGFYYPGPVLDLLGLVSPEALGRSMADVLQAGEARWVVSYASYLDPGLLASPWFTRTFLLRAERPGIGGRTLQVYERVR